MSDEEPPAADGFPDLGQMWIREPSLMVGRRVRSHGGDDARPSPAAQAESPAPKPAELETFWPKNCFRTIRAAKLSNSGHETSRRRTNPPAGRGLRDRRPMPARAGMPLRDRSPTPAGAGGGLRSCRGVPAQAAMGLRDCRGAPARTGTGLRSRRCPAAEAATPFPDESAPVAGAETVLRDRRRRHSHPGKAKRRPRTWHRRRFGQGGRSLPRHSGWG